MRIRFVIVGLFALQLGLSRHCSSATAWPSDVKLNTEQVATPTRVLSSDGEGGAYVGWQSDASHNYSPHLRHVSVDGSTWPAPIDLPPSTWIRSVASDDSGGVYVGLVGTSSGQVWHVNSDASATIVPIDTILPAADNASIQISQGPSGSFYIAYSEGPTVRLGLITKRGAIGRGWPVDGAIALGASDGSQIQLTTDHFGDAIVSAVRTNAGVPQVSLQRFTRDGTLAPGWPTTGILVAGRPGSSPLLRCADGLGGLVIIWTTPDTVFATRVDALGQIPAGWNAMGNVLATGRTNGGLSACDDGEGGIFFSWDGYVDQVTTDIFVQRLNAVGAIPAGWPEVGTDVSNVPYPGREFAPSICSNGAGGAIVAWFDERATFSGFYNVFANEIQGDGTLAPGWPSSGSAATTMFGQQPYVQQLYPIGISSVDHTAIIAWDQGDAFGQSVEAQRIQPAFGVGILRTQTIHAGLALIPNPCAGHTQLRATMGQPGAARIDVFDVTGRRVWSRSATMRAGVNRERIDLPTRACGVFQVRLTTSDGVRIATLATLK